LEKTMIDDKARDLSFAFRLLATLGWTALCGMLWILWVGSMADPANGASEEAVAMGACMATGCAGSAWFGGLVVAMVIYSLLRR